MQRLGQPLAQRTVQFFAALLRPVVQAAVPAPAGRAGPSRPVHAMAGAGTPGAAVFPAVASAPGVPRAGQRPRSPAGPGLPPAPRREPWRAARRVMAALLAALLLQGLLAVAGGASPAVRAGQALWAVRVGARQVVVGVPAPGQEWLEGKGVRVRYPAGHREGARWVRDYAEAMLPRVARVTGLELPAAPAVFVVHESPADLARSFGWDPDDPPLGFYAAGVIHVADPLTWAGTWETFARSGPVPHELAHWLLDRATYGNYPAWFTEGLAQAVDRELTGFTFSWAGTCPPVDWEELNRSFQSLSTDEAYGAALCLYDRMAARGGRAALARLVRGLAAGRSFTRAAQEAYGIDVAALASPGAQPPAGGAGARP